MKINIKEINPAVWFDITGTDARIKIRLCSSEEFANINKQCNQKQIEYKLGRRYEYDNIDNDKMNELFWDYSIVTWENINDETDKPIVCNKANKIMLMSKYPQFANFVADCLDKLSKWEIANKENEEKNSLTSQDGL